MVCSRSFPSAAALAVGALSACLAGAPAQAQAQDVAVTVTFGNGIAVPMTVGMDGGHWDRLPPDGSVARTAALAAAPGAYRSFRIALEWPGGRCEATLRARPAPEPLIPPDCLGAGSLRQGGALCAWESRPDGDACAVAVTVRPE
ncbi:MAG: hypothetical protein IT561_20310 [Alphaproteobacteria bacterium]|nr:hypothetical protein [Alphaproteobacteria bacterium]